MAPPHRLSPGTLSFYLILDPVLCGGHQPCVDLLVRVLSLGVSTVQLRAPQWHKGAILSLALDLLPVLRAHSVPLIIDDHVDVALAAGADGVHIGRRDLPPEAVRRLLGGQAIVGFSANSAADVERANALGTAVDYLGVGPVFATDTKPDHLPPIGVAGLRQLCANARHPVVAIGGIQLTNAFEVVQSGRPNGLAVISAICGAEHPEQAARKLNAIIRSARAHI